MKSFGEWVKKLRQGSGMDIRSFAKRIGVDHSTISRIENTVTQPTLATAISICAAFDISLQTLLEELGYPNIGITKNTTLNLNNVLVLTYNDIKKFIELLRNNPLWALELLSNLTDKLAVSSDNKSSIKLFPGIDGPIQPIQFRFFVDPPPFFKVELQYPPNVSAQMILHIYLAGGVINLMDVGAYLRYLRTQRKATLAELAGVSKRSASVLGKLELGEIEKVKLNDILELDQEFGEQNEIIAFYWDAILLNSKITNVQVNADLVNLLIVTCRWLHNDLSPYPPAWLRDFRYGLDAK